MKKIDQDVLTFKGEKEMLEKFLEIIDNFDPDIIVGYNINDFDMPYINERLKINKMRRSIGRCIEKQLVSRSLGENRYKNSVFGRAIVDPYWMIKDMAGRGFFTGLKRFSLEDVSQYLLGEGKIEFSHKDIPIAWNGNEEQMKKFIDYARRDSELVLRLLLEKQLLDKYIGISKVSGLLLQDSLDTGEAGKVENLLLREFDKEGFVLPCKPTEKEIARRKAERDVKGFKGAFVLEPEVGLHTNCVCYLDFACHPLGTKVVVKGIGEKDISEVKEGEFVLGKNGWHKVVKKWEYDYKGYLININGLRCTPNHKIPVLKENERQKFVRDATAISLFKNKVKGKLIFLKEFGNIRKRENQKMAEEQVPKNESFCEAKIPEFSLEFYEGKVYDLTLNSEPYYFANGILTHNSMYPSIFISYNICPTTLLTEKREDIEAITTPFGTSFVPPSVRKGIVPRTLERLIKERNAVKAQMKAEKDPVRKRALDSYQEGLKRIANASYGYTGFLLGRIYVLNIANAITSCGRYYIQETKRLVEANTKYKVIYGDTDSVMIKTDTQDIEKAIEIGNNIANFLNEKFQGKLRIKVENVFKTLLILTKKRYAGWSFEKVDSQLKDEIVMKGIETVRRDWCDLVSETQEEVLKILLKEQNPKKAFAYFKEVVQKLQNGLIPLEKLTIIKGISKRPEQYKGVQPHVELVKKMRKRGEVDIPNIGDRVGFVIVKGLQLVSERAEDPEYVKKHGLKIDSKYYIESQLLPPLERVFEAIGVNRSELIGLGKQMLLGEAINNHKKVEGKTLSQMEGIICVKCNTTFRRVPLIGRCTACGGELEFYFGEHRAKILSF
jgi:DNA polymerase elongation subunit (family B)